MTNDNWIITAAEWITSWPFQLPTVARRIMIVLFPITLPLWILVVVVCAIPLMMAGLMWEAVTEMWQGN